MKHSCIIAIALLLAACTQAQTLETQEFMLRGPAGESVALTAEVADDPEEQMRGLMFRTSLARDAGMIFVYDTAEQRSFWMKNTVMLLDIAFFDSDGVLVHKTTMYPCESDPCEIYPSVHPARFILEMEEGWLERNGVEAGWRLEPLPARP